MHWEGWPGRTQKSPGAQAVPSLWVPSSRIGGSRPEPFLWIGWRGRELGAGTAAGRGGHLSTECLGDRHRVSVHLSQGESRGRVDLNTGR